MIEFPHAQGHPDRVVGGIIVISGAQQALGEALVFVHPFGADSTVCP